MLGTKPILLKNIQIDAITIDESAAEKWYKIDLQCFAYTARLYYVHIYVYLCNGYRHRYYSYHFQKIHK